MQAAAIEEGFAADATPGQHYLNRELSTLDFDGRVLALAEHRDLPLLERIKFLAIFAANRLRDRAAG